MIEETLDLVLLGAFMNYWEREFATKHTAEKNVSMMNLNVDGVLEDTTKE